MGATLEVTPEMLKAFFIDGLLKHIKTYVLLRQPASLSEAFQLAKQAEHIIPNEESTLIHQVRDLNQKLEKLDDKLIPKTQPTTAAINIDYDNSLDNMEKKNPGHGK